MWDGGDINIFQCFSVSPACPQYGDNDRGQRVATGDRAELSSGIQSITCQMRAAPVP
jgi:hypothetical protein